MDWDWHQQREKDFKRHIDKDLALQNELEDTLRCEGDVKEREKIKRQIQELEESIITRRNKIKLLIQERQEQEALISRQMPAITFEELDVVTKSIITVPIKTAPPETNFELTNPEEKMSKNRLTDKVLFLLTMGMAKVWEVNKYVDIYGALNSSFPEKLKAGFIQEYKRLRAAGFDGDDLFDALCKFSSGNSTDTKQIAAGIAVLSYLFWKCEVFER